MHAVSTPLKSNKMRRVRVKVLVEPPSCVDRPTRVDRPAGRRAKQGHAAWVRYTNGVLSRLD